MTAAKVRGHVLYWADKQGHGKAVLANGTTVFLHWKYFVARAQGERISLNEGQWVRFGIVQDAKGPRATDIEIE